MAHLDIPVAMRWTDLDAYGHVNNAATVRLLEEGRIEAFWAPSAEEEQRGAVRRPTALPAFGVDGSAMTLVASQRIEYLRPIPYRRDGVLVRLWLSRLGGASMDVDYLVLGTDDTAAERPYAKARTVMVTLDRQTQQPMRLDEGTRAQLAPWIAEPLELRA